MKEESFTVGAVGGRLDRFLAERLAGFSRGHCKALVSKGRVTVDGKTRPPDYRLRAGEVVRAVVGACAWGVSGFEDWVLFEDKDVVVLHKPSGVVCHPVGESWLTRTEAVLDEEEATLAGILWKARPVVRDSGVERCGLVHRLDRQTSGVLIVAKRPRAQKTLLAAFRERTVSKVYRAVVIGTLAKTKVDAPIGRLPGRRKVQVSPWGKEASTDFKSVESRGGMSLIEARPRTGRTHQIRAHLALLGHPVAGDHEWFRESQTRELSRLGHAPPSRMMLHAYSLRLAHPATGKAVSFTAPLPKDFRDYWSALKV